MPTALVRQNIGVVGILPGLILMTTDDPSDLVFSPGYINSIQGVSAVQVSPNDVIHASSSVDGLLVCTPNFGSNGIITLVDIAGFGPNRGVMLPLTFTNSEDVSINSTFCDAHVVYNNADEAAFSFPGPNNTTIPIGTNIDFTQLGDGAIRFVAPEDVTIVWSGSGAVTTNGVGSTCSAYRYTSGIWILSGNLTGGD